MPRALTVQRTLVTPPERKKFAELVAMPMSRGWAAFCTARTSTCMVMPSPRPSSAMSRLTTTSDVPTAAVVNFLVTHERASDDLVYQMTKAMFENLPTMVASHAAAREIKLENALTGMAIPLHPGAARYYKEKGMNP